MAFTAQATTTIGAPIEVVWDVLTDFQRYHEWSKMLQFEGGELEVGSKIALRLNPPKGQGYSFSPEILSLEAPSHFAWIARTGITGVFDGEHHFRLRVGSTQAETVLENIERYSGIISPILKLLPQMQNLDSGFDTMNQEIRHRAETVYQQSK